MSRLGYPSLTRLQRAISSAHYTCGETRRDVGNMLETLKNKDTPQPLADDLYRATVDAVFNLDMAYSALSHCKQLVDKELNYE